MCYSFGSCAWWRWWLVLGVVLTGGCAEPPAGNSAPVRSKSGAAKVAAAGAGIRPSGPFWPRFHGPNGDNLSTETGLLKQWAEKGPALLWTAKNMGEGYSSVTIAGGLIYTAGNLDGKTMITALDMEGQIQWQRPNGPAWTDDYPGTRGTPTIDGARLFHESPLGEVVCLDAKTGEKIWAKNILAEFGAENIRWALAESLVIDADRVICCPGGPKASVVALDKNTGSMVWAAKSTGDKAGYATPTLAEHQGLRMVLAMNQRALIGVNADNGDLLWRFEHVTMYDVNATSPIFHDGQVFITSGYGSGSVMLRLQVDGKKASVEEVWKAKELDNHHGGVILLDGHLYGSSHQGRWICLDWKTGQRKYAEKGVGKGSLTYADGMLYTLSENRDVGLVEATPDGHKLVSRFKMPSGGEGPSWAHPVVCGARLYLRHSDQLFAYDVRNAP